MNPFDMFRSEINAFMNYILGKWGIVHKGVYFTTKHILGKWGISRGNETLVTRDLDIAKSWSRDTNG